jgi:tRNA-Thr(GGU) m(6)t(6)A37 methyltransferase TsaA
LEPEKKSFAFQPIGVVHSPFKNKEDIPAERCASAEGFSDVRGEIEIFKEYEAGLKDTDGFSHLIIFFVFHQSRGFELITKPFLDSRRRGVFSTRSPHRPNPIGMTVVQVIGREQNVLRVAGVDMIEGTPILDIKPYTSRDIKRAVKLGWLKGKLKKGGCIHA